MTEIQDAKPIINEDCWSQIMLFGNKSDLIMMSEVSKNFKILSDRSRSWFYLCKDLWRNKQFHPLERWIKLEICQSDGCESQSFIPTSVPSKSGPHELQCIERTIVELEASKVIICDEMNLIIQERMSKLSSFKVNENDHNSDQINRLQALIEYKEKLEGRLVVWNEAKVKYFQDLEHDHNGSVVSSSDVKLTRQAAPLSRAIRAQWIRDTEFEYFNALDQIQMIRKELDYLSGPDFDLDTQVEDEYQASISELETTADQAEDLAENREVNTASREDIIAALNEQFEFFMSRATNLQSEIVSNLSRPVDLRAERAKAVSDGTLLTWKESYRASIIDSQRVICTPEELREFGDVIIMFGNVLERLRFVRGGLSFFDMRTFVHREGWFEIHGGEFYVPQVGGTGSVLRIASDWGWEFPCQQGLIRMATYDRTKGLHNHRGTLSRELAAQKWEVPQVSGPLLNSNPVFGLYTTETCNAESENSNH